MSDAKQRIERHIHQAEEMFLKDIEALSEEQLSNSPGGTARPPYDFIYEIVLVNHRIAARVKGEDPGPWPGPENGFLTAPDEFKNKDGAIAQVKSSVADVIAAMHSVPDDELYREMDSPMGKSSKGEQAEFAGVHMIYHDGQLNYVQSLNGDHAVHWW